MSNFARDVADIQKLAKKLATTKKTLDETEEYLAIVSKAEMAEIEKLEDEKRRIDDQIATLRMRISEKHPETAEDAERLTNEQKKIERDIKAMCHKLDTERLAKKGVKIYDNDDAPRVTITVSKAQVATAYDAEAVLRQYPGLEDLKTDEGSAVVKTIRPEIVDQLVSEGRVNKDIQSLATIHKKRAPGVRINCE